MNISFAWTTPALLAGRKTVTRRHWDRRYAGRGEKGAIVPALRQVRPCPQLQRAPRRLPGREAAPDTTVTIR